MVTLNKSDVVWLKLSGGLVVILIAVASWIGQVIWSKADCAESRSGLNEMLLRDAVVPRLERIERQLDKLNQKVGGENVGIQ